MRICTSHKTPVPLFKRRARTASFRFLVLQLISCSPRLWTWTCWLHYTAHTMRLPIPPQLLFITLEQIAGLEPAPSVWKTNVLTTYTISANLRCIHRWYSKWDSNPHAFATVFETAMSTYSITGASGRFNAQPPWAGFYVSNKRENPKPLLTPIAEMGRCKYPLVEIKGFEPLTLYLQNRCSSNWTISPLYWCGWRDSNPRHIDFFVN